MPDDKDILDPELDSDDELKPVAPIAEEDDHDSLDEMADAEEEEDENEVDLAYRDDD